MVASASSASVEAENPPIDRSVAALNAFLAPVEAVAQFPNSAAAVLLVFTHPAVIACAIQAIDARPLKNWF